MAAENEATDLAPGADTGADTDTDAGTDTDTDALREYEAKTSPFVERFAADLTEAGMQRMASRVFACLLASENGALTSAELSERLQISPAAVSGAVRYLSQVRMVSRQRSPGSRREQYLLHQDVWFSAMTNRERLLDRWTETLTAGVETIGPDSPAGRRLQETSDFLLFLQAELESVLARWHAKKKGTLEA